jgi:hypothetical protein
MKVLLASACMLAAGTVGLCAEEIFPADNAPFHVVAIDPEACNQLANVSGNGADFQAGVGADGSEVAPADLGTSFKPRDLYYFNVEIEPLGGTSQYSPLTSLDVASVELDMKTGRITIDGQDVSGADRALADACERQ